jgi:hypothetical protein
MAVLANVLPVLPRYTLPILSNFDKQDAMNCAECAILKAEHARLKQVYGAAVERLFATGYQVTDSEWATLKAATEEARRRSEIAEFRFEKHKRVHSRRRWQAAG